MPNSQSNLVHLLHFQGLRNFLTLAVSGVSLQEGIFKETLQKLMTEQRAFLDSCNLPRTVHPCFVATARTAEADQPVHAWEDSEVAAVVYSSF